MLVPKADCESMCAFVLLAGVHRTVPPEARVMVHQIWLGDRREDPTAASYSAEDLVLVQRDIGRLAKYTAEMGGKIELLDLALRIPPWEPMHVMTRAEIDRTQLASAVAATPDHATVAVKQPAPAAQPPSSVTDGVHAPKISERRWAVVEHDGSAVLARRHPLTIEGENIGSFDLLVACGTSPKSYQVSYLEQRHEGRQAALPSHLDSVIMLAGDSRAKLKVVSSRHSQPDELVTLASGNVPAKLIGGFAATGSHSMMITTQSGDVETAIRLGNTGAEKSLLQLAAVCHKELGVRAGLPQHDIGGLASAQ
jgi:hypothetical protein